MFQITFYMLWWVSDVIGFNEEKRIKSLELSISLLQQQIKELHQSTNSNQVDVKGRSKRKNGKKHIPHLADIFAKPALVLKPNHGNRHFRLPFLVQEIR